MSTLPKIPQWATQTFFPNLGGGNPWESGTSPTKVEPPLSIKDYGNTPDDPAVGAFDNWHKAGIVAAAEHTRKQHIGHWGLVTNEIANRTGTARAPMPSGGWLSLGYNSVTFVNTMVQLGSDLESLAPYQDGTSNVQDNSAYACTNLAGTFAWFHNAGVGKNVIGINLTTGVDGEEIPPLALVAEEWSDIFCTPQGSLLMGGVGRFAHRTVGGVWTVVTPAGLGVGINQKEWWFYSSPDCPTPNRTWAMNRCDEFLYSDDGGLTWSAVTTSTIAAGSDCVSRPVYDKATNLWVTVQCDDPTVNVSYKIYHSVDGLNWTNPGGNLNMNLTALAEFGGVIYGIGIIGGQPLAFRAAEIMYSTDAGLTWSRTGKILAFVCPTFGVGTFPHSFEYFERNFRIMKASWGLIAVAENRNSFLVHQCALKPYVDTYPVL